MPLRTPDRVVHRITTLAAALLAAFMLPEPTAAQTEPSRPPAQLETPDASSEGARVDLDGDQLWIGDGHARRVIDLGCEAAQVVVLDELAYARCPPNRVVRARIAAPFLRPAEFLVDGMREIQVVDGRLHVVRRDGSRVPFAHASRVPPRYRPVLDVPRAAGQAARRNDRVDRELFLAGGIVGAVGALGVVGGAIGNAISNICISSLGGGCSSSGPSEAVIGVWVAAGSTAGLGLVLVAAGAIVAAQPVEEARDDIAIDVEVGQHGLAMTLRGAF